MATTNVHKPVRTYTTNPGLPAICMLQSLLVQKWSPWQRLLRSWPITGKETAAASSSPLKQVIVRLNYVFTYNNDQMMQDSILCMYTCNIAHAHAHGHSYTVQTCAYTCRRSAQLYASTNLFLPPRFLWALWNKSKDTCNQGIDVWPKEYYHSYYTYSVEQYE